MLPSLTRFSVTRPSHGLIAVDKNLLGTWRRGCVGGRENSILRGGFGFQFKDDGWLYLGRVGKAFGRPHSSVLPHQLIQGTRIKGPHGAGGDTDGFQSLRQSLDAKVAFLHLGIHFQPQIEGRHRDTLLNKARSFPCPGRTPDPRSQRHYLLSCESPGPGRLQHNWAWRNGSNIAAGKIHVIGDIVLPLRS